MMKNLRLSETPPPQDRESDENSGDDNVSDGEWGFKTAVAC